MSPLCVFSSAFQICIFISLFLSAMDGFTLRRKCAILEFLTLNVKYKLHAMISQISSL